MSDLDSTISILQDKLNLSCIHSPMVTELMRGIRSQIEGLITGLPSREMAAMCLGLAHRWVPSTALSHPATTLLLCPRLLCAVIWFHIHFINQHTSVLEACFTGIFQFATTFLGKGFSLTPKLIASFPFTTEFSLKCLCSSWVVSLKLHCHLEIGGLRFADLHWHTCTYNVYNVNIKGREIFSFSPSCLARFSGAVVK